MSEINWRGPVAYSSGLFAPDGCVLPNIRTRHYRIDIAAKCEHTKIRGAMIFIDAESAEAARRFAETSLLQGPLGTQSVIAGVFEVSASNGS